MGEVRNIGDRPVYVCAAEGPSLAADFELSGLIGELFGLSLRCVAIPLERLGPDFLRLSTGVAGQVGEKLVELPLPGGRAGRRLRPGPPAPRSATSSASPTADARWWFHGRGGDLDALAGEGSSPEGKRETPPPHPNCRSSASTFAEPPAATTTYCLPCAS